CAASRARCGACSTSPRSPSCSSFSRAARKRSRRSAARAAPPERTAPVKRPPNLIYWLNDKPPLGVTALSGLQHVGLVSIFLLVPVIACRQAGLAPEKIVDVLSLSMLVMAAGPLLQRFGRAGVGSGYLFPPLFAAPYPPAAVLALQAGWAP